ncbi:MAG: hypothetical protein ACK5PS_19335 [Desulfopila sp.]
MPYPVSTFNDCQWSDAVRENTAAPSARMVQGQENTPGFKYEKIQSSQPTLDRQGKTALEDPDQRGERGIYR